MPRFRFKRFVLYPLVRGLTGFPLALAAILGAPFGLSRIAAAGQRRIAERFGRLEPAPGRAGYGRSLLFSLATLIPSLAAFAVALICLLMVYTGYLYPIRPGVFEYIAEPFTQQAGLEGAWGGNTVVGAWLTHSAIAIGLHVLGLALLYFGYARLQDALVRTLLRGAARPGPTAPGGDAVAGPARPGTARAAAPPRP